MRKDRRKGSPSRGHLPRQRRQLSVTSGLFSPRISTTNRKKKETEVKEIIINNINNNDNNISSQYRKSVSFTCLWSGGGAVGAAEGSTAHRVPTSRNSCSATPLTPPWPAVPNRHGRFQVDEAIGDDRRQLRLTNAYARVPSVRAVISREGHAPGGLAPSLVRPHFA